MKKILIIHPEGNIYNNPNLLGIVEILSENNYHVDVYSLKRDNIYQTSEKNSINLYLFSSDGIVDFNSGYVCLAEKKPKNENELFEIISEIPYYDLIIGVDRGIIEASIIANVKKISLGYISYEIFFKNESSDNFKNPEIKSCKEIEFAVVQDEVRAQKLSEENQISLDKMILIPVANRISHPHVRDYYFNDLFSIDKNKKIALFAGSVAQWSRIDYIINSVSTWNDDWVLVIHSRYAFGSEIYKKKCSFNPKKIFFSDLPVDNANELSKIMNSADIGIGMYKATYESIFQGRNLEYIGLASGKICSYFQHGLPVIVNDIGEITKYINRFNCGIVVDTNNFFQINLDIPTLDLMSRNAIKLFDEELDLQIKIVPLLNKIYKICNRSLLCINKLANDYVEKTVSNALYDADQKNLQAKTLAESGKISEAIVLFEEIAVAEPLHFKANFNLGVLYSQQNELKKATRCYLKCLESKPNDRNTVINLTYTLKNLGKSAEAEKIIATYLIENYDDQEMKNLLVAINDTGVKVEKLDLVEQKFKSTLIYIDPGYQDSFGHYMQMGRNIRAEAEFQGIEVLHFVNQKVTQAVVSQEKLIPFFQDIAFITDRTADYSRVLKDFEARLVEIRDSFVNRDGKPTVIYMYTAHPLHFPIFARVFGDSNNEHLKIVLNLFYLDSIFCNGGLNSYYDYLLRKCYEEFLAFNKSNRVKVVYESEQAARLYQPYFGKRDIFDAQPVGKTNPLCFNRISGNQKSVIAYIGHTNEKSGYHLVYQAYRMLMQTSLKDKTHFRIKHSKKFYDDNFLRMYNEFNACTQSIDHYNGFISAEDYNNFYNDCDIVLLPYSKKHYPLQTSGVLVDAVLAKKIVIAPRDTWMGNIVEKYHFGVTFKSDSLEDFINAIIVVVGKLSEYKTSLEVNYQKFAQQHSANNLLMQLGFDLQSDQESYAKK